MSRIGDKLNKIRLSKGLTPKALAKKVGVSESFILEVESGKRIPNESLINRLSKVLESNLNDIADFNSMAEAEKNIDTQNAARQSKEKKAVKSASTPASPQWEHAFSSIITDIPVYNSTMAEISGTIKAVVIDNKVEGIPIDKAFYIKMDAPLKDSFRLKKGDLILVHPMTEANSQGLYIIKQDNEIKLRQIKQSDNRLILAYSQNGAISTETVSPKDITVVGKCIKAELML